MFLNRLGHLTYLLIPKFQSVFILIISKETWRRSTSIISAALVTTNSTHVWYVLNPMAKDDV